MNETQKFIDYLDSRIYSPEHCDGTWHRVDGKHCTIDLSSVVDWWRDCMRPELEMLVKENKE